MLARYPCILVISKYYRIESSPENYLFYLKENIIINGHDGGSFQEESKLQKVFSLLQELQYS